MTEHSNPIECLVKLGLLALMVVVALVVTMVCADLAPWYLGWLMGTTMMVLISVAGAILFDHQEEVRHSQGNREY